MLPGSQHFWLLALGGTLLPFALALVAMRRPSAFSTGLVLNLEPVYAIVLLDEQREFGTRFYVGATIILCVVFIHPLLREKLGDLS